MATRPDSVTADAFIELIREDQKADLLEGALYMASPENWLHNHIESWLGGILSQYVDERQLGAVVISRCAFRLTDDTVVEPDVAFVSAARMNLLNRSVFEGPPDLAVEIVSPDSKRRDYIEKRGIYERAALPEYWIVDPAERDFVALRHDGARYCEAALDGSVCRSQVVDGFWLDVAWLWESPRRSQREVMNRILP